VNSFSNWLQQTRQRKAKRWFDEQSFTGFQRTHGTLWKVDLSVDIEKISGQLQKLTDKVPDLNVEKISSVTA